MRRATSMVIPVLLMALCLALVGCSGSSPEKRITSSAGSAVGGAPSEQSGDAAAELPPAPSDVSGVKGWLEAAYPDAVWLARIKKVEYVAGEVPDSGGFANAIVLTTDLDFAKEAALADEINAAIGEAHPSWAKQVVIKFADGDNILAGDIFDRTP